MATRVDAKEKEILVLTQEEFQSINALLYVLRNSPEVVATLNSQHAAGLGSNHRDILTSMWESIHNN